MAEGSRLEPSPLIPNETGRVKLMVVDEAWRYLRDPPVLAYLAEAGRAIGTAGRTGSQPRQPADGRHFGRIQPALSTVLGAYETKNLAGACVRVITA